jgi:hypothetical protein
VGGARRCGARVANLGPVPAPRTTIEDVAALLQLVDAAETAYAQLIDEHVEYAERMLELYAAQLAFVDVETARDQGGAWQ